MIPSDRYARAIPQACLNPIEINAKRRAAFCRKGSEVKVSAFRRLFRRLWWTDPGFNGGNHGFYEEFLDEAPNAWIRENARVERVLGKFFAAFPTITLNRLRNRRLFFVSCSGEMSATITYDKAASVVLLFPEILRNLESANPSEAFAILAHELGHVVCEHSKRGTPQLQAQIEADAFACSLGFKHEICSLLEREESEEGRIRLGVIAREVEISFPKVA